MVWTSVEAHRLLDHRLLVRCASRPKVSGICRFDINDSEPFNLIYEICTDYQDPATFRAAIYMEDNSMVRSEKRT